MRRKLAGASLLLRIAVGLTLLSAVADRFGWWDAAVSSWGNWSAFLKYTAAVNAFAPPAIIPMLALTATILETVFGFMLILGFKTRWAAIGTALLTLAFGISMSISFGIKSPLDYSVFVDATAAFLLACLPEYRWSMDHWIQKTKQSRK